MDSTVLTITLAIFASFTAPLTLLYFTSRSAARDRESAAELALEVQKATWEREDRVAARAEKTAADLAKSQRAIAATAEDVRLKAEEAARLLVLNNELVARTSTGLTGKLDVIHELVNSNLTHQMQTTLDATERELAMMREVAALHQAAGREPSPETLAAIEATQRKVADMRSTLADRVKAQERANRAADKIPADQGERDKYTADPEEADPDE